MRTKIVNSLFLKSLHFCFYRNKFGRPRIMVFLLLLAFGLSFPQTSEDTEINIGRGSFNFVLDDEENFHISWGSSSIGIWYSVFNSYWDKIKELNFPNTLACGESNIALRDTNIVVAWRYLSLTFNSYIIGQVFSIFQDSANDYNVNFYDPYGDAERAGVTIDFFDDSTFIVAWYGGGPQTNPGQYGVYGEITNVSLTDLGGNFLISDSLNNTDASLQKILISSKDSSFFAIWRDNRTGINQVYGRLFGFTGNEKGDSFLISDYPETGEVFDLSGAADKKNGGYIVVWSVESEPYGQIRWRQIDSEGIPVGPSEPLTSEKETVLDFAAVGMDIDEEGKIIIVWEQEHNGYSAIYGRRYISINNPYGEIFKVSKLEYDYHQFGPLVKLKNNKIFTMWHHFKENAEGGVYTRIIDFYDTTLVGIKGNKNFNINTLSLSQNYPNPFNPITTIKYSIPSLTLIEESIVHLTVYDILGKKVVTLVNKKQLPGDYEVQFNAEKLSGDGNELSSGLYLYQLKYENLIQTKKMLLIK